MIKLGEILLKKRGGGIKQISETRWQSNINGVWILGIDATGFPALNPENCLYSHALSAQPTLQEWKT